ncbi:hypothetical protein GR183_12495 [Stappia sp. GBMRC 2046]|uniref:Uncharacterized protein n=1 Tax=Stappia sediminis TaxID=2692190 RepID=A0A7X3LV76_9HYPH|nr:hypothetical protein [Stappia sediminis]MXN65726.1 hypothetical protein [Stappia sediminis]
MGTVLNFAEAPRRAVRQGRPAGADGERKGVVVIFPGIRMEREGVDLSARIGRKLDRQQSEERGPGFPI